MGSRAELDARGFTLLELIVVLFVLAIAGGLALPTIGRSMDSIRTRSEIAGFSAVLRHAREQSISLRRTHEVVVDPVGRQMRVLTGEEVRRSRAIPARWTIQSGTASPRMTVRFEPEGNSTGGDFRIVAGDQTYRVTVDAITGRVRSLRQ